MLVPKLGLRPIQVLLALPFSMFVEPAVAQQCAEGTLMTPGGASGDLVGFSVAAYGKTAIVGAMSDDVAGSGAGAAFVFGLNGGNWQLTAELRASDAAAGDAFGNCVDVHKQVAVVAATLADTVAVDSGAVYVFELIGGTWVETAKLVASDAALGDGLGREVAVYGNLIVAGAAADDDFGAQSGAAYLFEKVGGTWVEVAKLLPADPEPNDVFGSTVDVFGTTVVVGSPKDDDADPGIPFFDSGSVYVFEKNGNAWQQQAKLTASNAAFDDLFGISLDSSLDRIVVGSFFDGAGGFNSGAAYVYQRDGNGTESMLDDTWDEVAILEANDAQESDFFGKAVAISGGRVIVGADREDSAGLNAGAAYVFERKNAWQQTLKLTPSAAGGRAGSSVALLGPVAIVGSPLADGSVQGSGKADVYCFQKVVYVKDGSQGGLDGTSWVNAYAQLQDALVGALPGDELWVAGGIYRPDQGGGFTPGDRFASFQMLSGVRLYGGFVGTEQLLEERGEELISILTGDLALDDGPNFANTGENSIHVVSGTGADGTAWLDRFVVRDGNANSGPHEGDAGAGINNRSGGATIRGCLITDNSAGTFNNGGAGAYNRLCEALFEDCDFVANDNISAGGSAVWNMASDVTLINCRFFGNTAPIGHGAAIASRNSRVTAIQCVFSGNTSGKKGGACYQFANSSLVLINCTVANNTSASGGGLYNETLGDQTIVSNSILYGNQDDDGSLETSQFNSVNTIIERSLVQGWTGNLPGTDVIGGDPLFRDPLGPDGILGTIDDDLRLVTGSLGIDTGDDALLPVGDKDLDENGVLDEVLPYDATGLPRLIDDPMALDVGPEGSSVDLGAFERVALSAPTETISLATGGKQELRLDAGPAHAGAPFLIVGSATGTSPGLMIDGLLLPLVPDWYSNFLLNASTAAILMPKLGLLDAKGTRQVVFKLPSGLDPSLAGTVLYHAFVTFVPVTLEVTHTSNAVSMTAVP